MAVSAGELTLFLSANTTSATRNLAAVDKQVTQLASRTPTVNVKANFAAVTASAKKLNEQLDETIQRSDTLAKVTFRNVDTSIQKSATLIGTTTQVLASSINTVAYALKQLSAFSMQLLQLPNVFSRVYQDVQRTYNTLEKVPGFGPRLAEGVGQFRKALVAAFAVLAPEKFTVGLYEELGEIVVGVAAKVQGIAIQTGKQILYGNFLGQLSENIDTAINDLARLGLAFQGLFEIANALQAIFGGAFDYLIGQNARLQETILSTQTVLASTTKVSQSGTEITDPLQKILALEGPVNTAIENIRRRSLKLAGVTSAEVINIFQTVATNIGAIGGTIKDAEDLAISFTAGLGTLGIPLFQAQQEISSILTGTVNQDSLLAQRLGITNADIQKARNTTDGVVGYIQTKLKTAVAGQAILATTLSGVTSNFRELFELVGQAAGKPLLTPLLAGLNAIFDNLYRLKGLFLDTAESVSEVLLSGFTTLFSQVASSSFVRELRDTYRAFSQQYADRNAQEEQGKSVGNLIKAALLSAEPEKIVSAQLLPVVKVFRDLRNEITLAAQSAAGPLAKLLTDQRGGATNAIQSVQKIASLFVLDPEINRQYDTVRSTIQELGGAILQLGTAFAKFKIREFGDTIRITTEVILQFGSAFLGAANLASSFFKTLSAFLDLPLVRFFNEVRIATKLVGLSDFVDNLKFVTGIALVFKNLGNGQIRKTFEAFKMGFEGALKVAPALGNSLGVVANQAEKLSSKLTGTVPALNQYQKAAQDAIAATTQSASKQLADTAGSKGAEVGAAIGQLTANQRLAALAGDVFSRVVDNVGRNLGYTAEEIKKYKDELLTLQTVQEGFKRAQRGVIAQFLTFQAAFIGLELALGLVVAAFSRYNEELARTDRRNKALAIANTPGFVGDVSQRILQLQRQERIQKDILTERANLARRINQIENQRKQDINRDPSVDGQKRANELADQLTKTAPQRLKQLEAEAALIRKQLEYRKLTIAEVLKLSEVERTAYIKGLERGLSQLNTQFDETVKQREEAQKYVKGLKDDSLDFGQRLQLAFITSLNGITLGEAKELKRKELQTQINALKKDEGKILGGIIAQQNQLNALIDAEQKKQQAIKTDRQGQDAKRDLAGIFTGTVEATSAKIEEIVQKLQERLRASSPTAPDFQEQLRAVELARNLAQDAGKSVLDKFTEASQVQADAARKVKEAEVEAADIRRNSIKTELQKRIEGINEESSQLLGLADEKRDRELDLQRQIRKSQEDIAEIQRKSWLNQVRQARIIQAILEGIELPGLKPATDIKLLAKALRSAGLTLTADQYKQYTGQGINYRELASNPALQLKGIEAYLQTEGIFAGKEPKAVLDLVGAASTKDAAKAKQFSNLAFSYFQDLYRDQYSTPYLSLAQRKQLARQKLNPVAIADSDPSLKALAQVDPLRGLKLEGTALQSEQQAQGTLRGALQQALAVVSRSPSPGARYAQRILFGLQNTANDKGSENAKRLAVSTARTPQERYNAARELREYEAYGRARERFSTTISQFNALVSQLYAQGEQGLVDELFKLIKILEEGKRRLYDPSFLREANAQIQKALKSDVFTESGTKLADDLEAVTQEIANYKAGLGGTVSSIKEEVEQAFKTLFPQGYSATDLGAVELANAARKVVTLQAVLKRTATALANIPQTLAEMTANDAEIQAILQGPQAYEQYLKQKPLMDAVGGADQLAAIRTSLAGIGDQAVSIQEIKRFAAEGVLTADQEKLLTTALEQSGKGAKTLSELLEQLAETLIKAADSTKQLQLAQNLANQDKTNLSSRVQLQAALGQISPEEAQIRQQEIQSGAVFSPEVREKYAAALREGAALQQQVQLVEQLRGGFSNLFTDVISGFDQAAQAGTSFWDAIRQAAGNFFNSLGKYLLDLSAKQAGDGILGFLGKVIPGLVPGGGVSAGGGFGLFDLLGGAGGAFGSAGSGFLGAATDLSWGASGLSFNPALGFANGGIARGGFKAFATGGIVNTPTLGLVGEGRYNEAVVPLPDGKSIPVQLAGGGAGGVQIGSVNISVQNTGETLSVEAQRSIANQARAIAVEEIVRQTRSGGVLRQGGFR
jgi:hypothetical protein